MARGLLPTVCQLVSWLSFIKEIKVSTTHLSDHLKKRMVREKLKNYVASQRNVVRSNQMHESFVCRFCVDTVIELVFDMML